MARGSAPPPYSFHAFAHPFAELVEVRPATRNADDRKARIAALDHPMQGGKNLFVGEIPRRAEQNEGVRLITVVVHPAAFVPRPDLGLHARAGRLLASFVNQAVTQPRARARTALALAAGVVR